MILSMTGFGRGTASSARKKITVDLKSLNSKQFDLMMRIPSAMREMEVEVRNTLALLMQRGKADAVVAVESLVGEAPARINLEALRNYKGQVEEMSAELGIPLPSDWYHVLLRMPEATRCETPGYDDTDFEALRLAVKEAADALADSRLREGRRLYAFFIEKIEAITTLLDSVEPYEEERVPAVRVRLEEQLSRLDSIEYDRGRLEQELIFYIEKLDVTEEKLRLRSHLNYFMETMGPEDEIPVSGQGKKLGFIAQEMGREINTLGSKANHAEIQRIVVMMKDELEQIKEQVLNVL
ncbi:MAG: YicC family protein [Muribaculaceae bacterium]|nr:YicC family protein [Muribaculaceae bacterium]